MPQNMEHFNSLLALCSARTQFGHAQPQLQIKPQIRFCDDGPRLHFARLPRSSTFPMRPGPVVHAVSRAWQVRGNMHTARIWPHRRRLTWPHMALSPTKHFYWKACGHGPTTSNCGFRSIRNSCLIPNAVVIAVVFKHCTSSA